MAVVLAIVAVLSGGVLIAARLQKSQRDYDDTQQSLSEAHEALISYAAIVGHLPCPAPLNTTDGTEVRNGAGECNNGRGLLPWGTLGVPGIDAWGRRLSYQVSASYAGPDKPQRDGTGADLAAGDIRLCTRDASGNAIDLVTSTTLAFVVWSAGENGFHGVTAGAPRQLGDSNAGNADEDDNNPGRAAAAAADCDLFDRPQSDNAGAAGGAFDDTLIWAPTYIVVGRMIAAGNYP